MKENKIFSFISLFTLFCINPLFYWFGFKSSPLLNSKWFNLFYIFLILLLLLFYIFQFKGKISKKINNYIFFIDVLIIFYTFIFLVDKFLINEEQKSINDIHQINYLFPPHSNANYKTSEFQYSAYINSQGLRDKEYNIKKSSKKTRILFVGDSFTFGWGVENEFSVPKRLESVLNNESNKKEYEIINCGKGGTSVTDYVNTIETYSKIYKPDYVFIGFLQLDDLAQEYEKWFLDSLSFVNTKSEKEINISKVQMFINDFIDISFGNISATFNYRGSKVIEVKDDYKKQARSIYESLNNYQKMKFSMLDESLRRIFMEGNLNPSLMNIYINFPERSIVFNDPKKYVTQKAILLTKQKFKAIKKTSEKFDFKVIVFNIPANNMTGHNVIRSNFEHYFNNNLTNNNHIDSIYREISKSVNFYHYDFTDEFKKYKNKDVLFFKYDGHMTALGNSFLSDCIYSKIKIYLKK
jgi:hypothetical protein